MRSYASAAELSAEINKRGRLFIDEFASIPTEAFDKVCQGVDRTPRQLIAYQLGWLDLLLGWERNEKAGLTVVTPAPGYKWNQLGGLYESFYEKWATATPQQLITEFTNRVNQVCTWVTSLTETELFGQDQRAWASSTPSAWPVWKWIHINTVAPFTTFRTKVRKWKKLCAAEQ